MSPPCSYEQRRPLDPTTTLRHKQTQSRDSNLVAIG